MQEWSFFMINLLGLVQRKAMEVKMLGNIIFHLNSAKKWDAKLFWYQFTSVIPQMIFTYLCKRSIASTLTILSHFRGLL